MRYTVSVQLCDDFGALLSPDIPDALSVFDFPHDAKQHLLALVADEIATTTQTMCRWIDVGTVELLQPYREAPCRRQRFQVVRTNAIE